ncbi:MAG: hypothetical protein MJZ68_09355, partial [archaeon]|nr:hypothetical protein [archaeon]
MRIKSDGFIGSVMAVEGISDAAVLMHGPDGCRKNLTVLSSKVYPRPDRDCCDMGAPYYHGMPRIPCTGIVSTDYIQGAYSKLVDALSYVKERNDRLVAIVCSPGASLIGDDVGKAIRECGMEERALRMETNLVSIPLSEGMDITLRNVAGHLAVRSDVVDKERVNVLGLNVLSKDWTTVKEEISHILGLMDLEPGCFLGAGCSVQEIADSSSAGFNLVLQPEYAKATAEFYAGTFGTVNIDISYAPVGFDAMEQMIMAIAEATGKDPSKALEYVSGYCRRAFSCLSAPRTEVKGRSFAIDADPSVACPLTIWLYESFSMVPVSVKFNGACNERAEESLKRFLEEKDL